MNKNISMSNNNLQNMLKKQPIAITENSLLSNVSSPSLNAKNTQMSNISL